MVKLILFLLLFSFSAEAATFRQSKVTAHRKIYTGDLQVDYYCGCLYNRSKSVDLNSCGYKIRKNALRAKRIEFEHVIPASTYGKTESCWKDGGRKNCTKNSETFNKFEADLHNLRPVIGEVNGDRNNLPYGIVGQEHVSYGQCNFKIDFNLNIAEPPDDIKGDMARITLYLKEKYNLPYSDEYVIMLIGWMKRDPVSEKEIKINTLIRAYQGDSNYYIDQNAREINK